MRLELHEKQTEAFTTPATELLYGGAAGGGKSHLMRVASIAWSIEIPGLQTYLFRRVSNDLVKNHMEGTTGYSMLLNEFVDSKHVKINYSDNTISFWNGSKIFLCHCQHEKDRYKYIGVEIGFLLIDELVTFTPVIYKFLRGRVRLGGTKVPDKYKGYFPRILCGSNPGNVGHTWVKSSFIDGCEPYELRQMQAEEGGLLRQYIPARLADNPTMTENDPSYADRLSGLGDPALVRAMLEGDWDIVAGGMFDDVWRRETHVIPAFDIPAEWEILRGFDWGSAKPFSVLWTTEAAWQFEHAGRVYPRGTTFVVGEWYGWSGEPDVGLRMTAREIGEGIMEREARLFPGRTVSPGPADSAIFSTENGNCIADDLRASGVAFIPADKRPGSRVNGWAIIRQRLKAGMSSPMEDAGLFVFEGRCNDGLVRTLPVAPRDDTRHDDIDTKSEDHALDALRYLLTTKRVTKGWDLS